MGLLAIAVSIVFTVSRQLAFVLTKVVDSKVQQRDVKDGEKSVKEEFVIA